MAKFRDLTYCKYCGIKTSQFKTGCKDGSGYVSQLKQQKSKTDITCQQIEYILLLSNITFFIFAVSLVKHSHCRPYKLQAPF